MSRLIPRKFSVERLLTPRDFEAFQRLLFDRQQTTDSLTEWLRRRGYEVGRSAVGRYRQAEWHKCQGGDASTRQRLAELAYRLNGQSLVAVTQFAAFLLSRTAARNVGGARRQSSAPSDHRAR